MNKCPKWKGRTQGGTLGQKGLLFFFRHMSLSFGYAILSVVVIFYMIVNHKEYKSIWFYFRKIRGHGPFRSFIKAYRNHFLFGQTLLDRFAIFAGKKNCFNITITGQELFDEIVNSPKGAVIASSHVGNFEISGCMLHQTRKRINSIVYGGEGPIIQLYREKILIENNVFPVPIMADMSHIFTINKVLRNGEILTIPCDRVYTGNKIATLSFLGRTASFPAGAYHLAAEFDVPVLTLFVMKESAKDYHIFINRIDNFPQENLSRKEKVEALAENYVLELEKMLKKYPEQWYNYYKFWN
ncbi:MAG: lipid A biosynthesis (KDO)2-(lauroyl)-lipid IVA acyltransferase [Bacteroidales bacterium]|nr:lipid A biosynthesis (KDO)2-(lauroyl)-lipid IVA acyltransferase [Bacteroidales bacterium]